MSLCVYACLLVFYSSEEDCSAQLRTPISDVTDGLLHLFRVVTNGIKREGLFGKSKDGYFENVHRFHHPLDRKKSELFLDLIDDAFVCGQPVNRIQSVFREPLCRLMFF